MSSTPIENVTNIGPAWCAREVVFFNGTYDTHIKTGEDYETRTLASLFTMEPENADKLAGPAFIPSMYRDYDAREHGVQRQRGHYVALTCDIDKGNVAPRQVQDLVRGFCGEAAYLIYSSPNARPNDRRWRAIIPLESPVSFYDWFDAQNALFNFMAGAGIECDRALERAAQPVFLPNVPDTHKSGEPLRSTDGKPLYYQRATTGTNAPGLSLDQGPVEAGIIAIRRKRAEDDAERERLKAEAEKRRASRETVTGGDLIADFNRSATLATLLESYGYKQCPRNAEDWRSPHQQGETYATRIMTADKWVSLSSSDASAGLGAACATGCYGDAYDLFVHFEHQGDHKAAFRQLHKERRDAQGVGKPPEWMNEIPIYDEPPEWLDPDAEPIYDEPVASDASAAPILPFFWFADAEPSLEANDFVEGLLTSTAMSVVYGPSNCGKTFFIVDLGLHVTMGKEWRGRAVDRGAVVYLSLEGAMGIRNRLTAFRKHYGLEGVQLPFIAMPRPVNLLNDDADVNAVIALVKHVAEVTQLPVRMVIIDTLSRAMAGGNENSPEDMTALIGNCDRIRDQTESHVCIVHHSGKDEARGARGHSSLRAATDTEIEIKRDPELTFSSVRVAKQRDLEAGDPFNFTLQSVSLGTNRRGKDVTSCVVTESDKTVVVGRASERLSEKEEAALKCLNNCLIAGGFETVTSCDTGYVTAVTVHAWKRSLQASNVIDRDNDNNARTQMRRIKNALVNKGKIEINEHHVWLA